MISAKDLSVDTLGSATITSPLVRLLCNDTYCKIGFLNDADRVLFDPLWRYTKDFLDRESEVPTLELAGPRRKIYFDPKKVTAAVVTCGGLCPGINDVIRALVMQLHYRYGVERILGIPFGYRGFIPEFGHAPVPLTPNVVSRIHETGGTILSSSRGRQDTKKIVDFLVEKGINMLFVIGGDGTLRAALEIAGETQARRMDTSVVGIPKTIDNDIRYIDQSFGFETAFSEAVRAISSAHTEAVGAVNGVGLVKLMGRHSGFIAAHAALAMNDVNVVLIPEVPFVLEGPHGFLACLRARIRSRGHAVIVVAEGAGQELMTGGRAGKDASGNVRLRDIGLFLKEKIELHFREQHTEVNVKYIDPSYLIRSIPASPQDSIYGMRLGQHAVHAAMSGRTKVVIGKRHQQFVHIPMNLLATGRKQVDPEGDIWLSVLEATGQPIQFQNEPAVTVRA